MVRRCNAGTCWENSDARPMKRRCRCGLRARKPIRLFPPVDRVRHGRARRSILSGCGRVQVIRRRYENPSGGTHAPVDDLIDLAHQGVSLAAREMCCRIGIDSASFSRAAANLHRIGGLKVSDEVLRQVVESQGRAVVAWPDDEQLELDFDAGQWRTPAREDGEAISRLYVGIDGFMLPMITDAEMGRRFEKAKERRQKRRRRRGVQRPRLKRHRGADQRYKEFKLITMYDQDQERKLMRVTRHGPPGAGKMLRGMAEDVHLHRAEQ